MQVELERFVQTIKDEMNHPEFAKIGLGNVDPERLKKAIDILVDASICRARPRSRKFSRARSYRRSGTFPRSCSRPMRSGTSFVDEGRTSGDRQPGRRGA